jgi:hypothetical protein
VNKMTVNRIGGDFDAGRMHAPKGSGGDPDAFLDLLNEHMKPEENVSLGEGVNSIGSIGSVSGAFHVPQMKVNSETYVSKEQLLGINQLIEQSEI